MEKEKKYSVENKVIHLKVLRKKIAVDYHTILGIGHDTERLRCNDNFLLLDSKIQEMAIVQITQYLFMLKDLKMDSLSAFKRSDSIAIEYALKNYPDVPKIFWVKSFDNMFKNNLCSLNLERLSNVISELKLQSDTITSNHLKEFKEKVKNKNTEEVDSVLKYAQNEGSDKLEKALKSAKKISKAYPLTTGQKLNGLNPNRSKDWDILAANFKGSKTYKTNFSVDKTAEKVRSELKKRGITPPIERVEYKHGKNNSIKITTKKTKSRSNKSVTNKARSKSSK
jgi:hypothetical protein